MGTFVAIRIVGQLGVMAEKSQFRWMDGVLCFQSDGFRQEREFVYSVCFSLKWLIQRRTFTNNQSQLQREREQPHYFYYY